MHGIRPLIAAALLSVLSAPAWAVNKCTGPDGKVVYQDAPCVGKGDSIDVRPSSGPAIPKAVPPKPSASVEVSAPGVLPTPAGQQQVPAKSPMVQEADACLAWYKPKLRDPAGAYYTELSKDGRVVSITVHATNGFGGYVTKEAACEFYNGRLDTDWTKIHAKRRGWSEG